jgi:glucosamine--fructose-6-phosphate aminotransferase (isomerizing)
MCGIVGMVNGHPVAADLVAALGRLEYRGYDSAGVALAGPGLPVHRILGRATDLVPVLEAEHPQGHAGIGHTRWATHGRAELRNAHPHRYGGVAVVHNGIIENHDALRRQLREKGHHFASDTDSEVIPHLMSEALAQGRTPVEALLETCRVLKGAYAIAAVTEAEPDRLLVARMGSPLVVARGAGVAATASDPAALAGMAQEYAALAEGEIAELSGQGVHFHPIRIQERRSTERRQQPRPVAVERRGQGRRAAQRSWQLIADPTAARADGRIFTHHTRREIAEQPEALAATDAALRGLALAPAVVACDRFTVIACGSSLFAGAVARDAIERAAGVTVDLEIASEYRDRSAPPQGVALLISQSGETADTIAAMGRFRAAGLPAIGMVNVRESAIGRAAEMVWPVTAGQEIGVAATKSFTSQLLALMRFSIALGEARGTGDVDYRAALAKALDAAPGICAEAEKSEPTARILAQRIAGEGEALFIGRGWGAALAQEGALKLKELSYIHAEGYPAGELKHGPIAVVREGSPVIVCTPGDAGQAKVLANASAVAARGARVVALTDAAGAEAASATAAETIILPGDALTAPFAQAVFMQLLAYHTALALGHDVDRPRNLAKSVTVE